MEGCAHVTSDKIRAQEGIMNTQVYTVTEICPFLIDTWTLSPTGTTMNVGICGYHQNIQGSLNE